jgi:hypothetical protein
MTLDDVLDLSKIDMDADAEDVAYQAMRVIGYLVEYLRERELISLI